MKYFLDTEFIEGFHKPLFGKRRHFIDLISIGIVREDGKELYLISKEYNYNNADEWVKENVIVPAYIDMVHGDQRNRLDADTFHKYLGYSNEEIKTLVLDFFGCWRDQHFYRAPDDIEVYGYYADYDWVLFCSLFGRMIDLPKGFPMYCNDLKQMLDVYCKSHDDYFGKDLSFEDRLHIMQPEQQKEHNALADAKWNKELYDTLYRNR